jgi:hypothetical protein
MSVSAGAPPRYGVGQGATGRKIVSYFHSLSNCGGARVLLVSRPWENSCLPTRCGQKRQLRFNGKHMEHDDGETVFRHACKLGLEGIVSKRRDSPTAPVARPTGSK